MIPLLFTHSSFLGLATLPSLELTTSAFKVEKALQHPAVGVLR